MAKSVTVIGASNIDICATSQASLISGDSNPGKVEQSFGGVGRNIAENLARLQLSVQFITAYGGDPFAALLKTHASHCHMDISKSLICEDMTCSTYICVNQPDGDNYVAVSDMDICTQLTPKFFEDKLDWINQNDAVLVEANLPADSLSYLADHITVPLFADSVSTVKSERLRPILSSLTGLKINRQEAEMLTHIRITEQDDIIAAASILHNTGVQYVFITMGAAGAFLSDGKEAIFFPSMVHDAINTNGCGDACLAGFVHSYLQGQDCAAMIRSSMAMAAICAASPKAVSEMVNPEALEKQLKFFQKEA